MMKDSTQERLNWYRRIAEKARPSCPMEDSEPDDPEDIEKVNVKFVQCQNCGSSEEKTGFDFHGARLNGCRCRPGEEDWRVIMVEVEQDASRRSIKPPAPRGTTTRGRR